MQIMQSLNSKFLNTLNRDIAYIELDNDTKDYIRSKFIDSFGVAVHSYYITMLLIKKES